MIEQDKKPFKFDLQRFAEGDEPVAPTYGSIEGDLRSMLAEPAPTEPAVPPTEPPVVNLEAPPIEPVVEPVQPPAEPQPAPAPENDPMANTIVQQLIEQNRMLQQSMQQQSEMMQQYIQNSMTNNAPQPSPEVIKTPEEMEAEKEAFMERFYANPMEALNEFTAKATEPLQSKLRAYEEREAWNSSIADMAGNKENYPEFENVRVRMGEILKERPYLVQSGDRIRALGDAYAIAMSERGFVQPSPAQPAQVSPADMMKNPDFIKQITSNPELMKLIAAEQARVIQSNSQQVPPMSPSSGVANVAPYIQNQPKEFGDEFESDLKQSLRQGLL